MKAIQAKNSTAAVEDHALESDLAEGWIQTALDQVLASLESGSRPAGGVRGISEGVPSIGGEHLNGDGGFRFHALKFVPHGFFEKMKRGHIEKSDILVVKDGATTGKVALVRDDFPYPMAVVNEHVFVCRLLDRLYPPFFFFFLFSQEGQNRILDNFRGSAQGGINQSFAPGTVVPIAPLAEQKRVVQKIEELLAQVNASRARLAKVGQILKRFRQAVLAAAFSGRLTEAWREQVGVLESAKSFAEEVLRERETNWERGRHRPPVCYEDVGLPGLPKGWAWHSFDTFVTDSFYGPRFAENEYSDKGIPTIRTTDISFDGRVILKDPPRIDLKEEKLRKFCIADGDLLVTRTGATIGKCAIYDEKLGPAIPGAYLIRFRLTHKSVPSRFLLSFLLSPQGQELLLGRSTAVAQPNVNATNISRIPVPLPSRHEIEEILLRVEALFKLAESIEKRVEAAAKRADKLTQAILAKAFRGELVPTEAELARRERRDYEPATALLERIRSDGDTTSVKSRGRGSERRI